MNDKCDTRAAEIARLCARLNDRTVWSGEKPNHTVRRLNIDRMEAAKVITTLYAERDALIAAAYEDAAQVVFEFTNIECELLGDDGEVIYAGNLNCGEHEAVRKRTPAHALAALGKIRGSERADAREKIRNEAQDAWVYANRRREAVQWIAAVILLGISAAIWLDLLGFAKW